MSDDTNSLQELGIEVEARGLGLSMAGETEAHMPYRRSGPANEAAPGPAATEAHGTLILTFAPEAPEQTIEVRYRPSTTPGEPPEVELHAQRWSDRRLKRDVRPL